MQRIPVDLSGCVVLCTASPAPRMRGRGSTEQRVDAATGVPLFEVGVCVVQPQARLSDAITVTVAGEPQNCTVGMPVVVQGLVASPWEVEGRHGVSFRAESVAPVQVPAGTGRRSAE